MSYSTNSRASRVRIGEPVEARPGHPVCGDALLGHVVADRAEVREVPAPDVVGVRLGDLLDVDAPMSLKSYHRLLSDAVPATPA